jgi:predicted double-glycine peptidase
VARTRLAIQGRRTSALRIIAISCALLEGLTSVHAQRAPIRDPERFYRKYPRSYQEIQRHQIVMQKFDYSCGAAVLATIARYYWGDKVDEARFLDLLPKLRLSEAELKDRIKNGLTLTDLRNLTNAAGYEATMAKVKFSELAQGRVPVVVGITVNEHKHFAVFRGTDGQFAYLADPIRGNVRTPVPTFLKQWQHNAILIVAKPNTPVAKVNPMGVRADEIDRGWLNYQTVRRNVLMQPVPNPLIIGP